MKTHKRVAALDKGEGLTYLSGENQHAVCQSLAVKPHCTGTGGSSHTKENKKKVTLTTGHVGGVLDTLG